MKDTAQKTSFALRHFPFDIRYSVGDRCSFVKCGIHFPVDPNAACGRNQTAGKPAR
jgi:hypothetical protein